MLSVLRRLLVKLMISGEAAMFAPIGCDESRKTRHCFDETGQEGR